MRHGLAAATLALLPFTAWGEIVHDSVACARAGGFPRLEAALAGGRVARARVFFRAKGSPHWYATAMTPAREGRLVGVLPRPAEGLEAFEYYIEVTDTAMRSSRTPDHLVVVGRGPADCRGGVMVMGLDSGTVAVEAPAGAPSLPAGFDSASVTAATSSAPASATASASAGGGGATTAVLVGAGVAAAAAAVAIAAAGDDSGGADGGGGEGSNGGGGNGGNAGGGGNPPGTTPGTTPSGPPVVGVSASTPVDDPVPFTLEVGGRTLSSNGELVRLEVALAPGAYEARVTAARSTVIFFGFRGGGVSGPGGVEIGSLEPSHALFNTTPPCGVGLQPSTSASVRFRVVPSGNVCP